MSWLEQWWFKRVEEAGRALRFRGVRRPQPTDGAAWIVLNNAAALNRM